MWTLWNAADLLQVLREKTGKLRGTKRTRRRCLCGASKPTELSFIKVDASQVFKDADTRRGTRRCSQLLDRVYKQSGNKEAVAIEVGPRAKGHLCYSKQKIPSTHRMVSFKLIRRAMQYAKMDAFFHIGGGHLSSCTRMAKGGVDVRTCNPHGFG